MKLTIGSIYLGKNQPNFAELSDEERIVKRISLEDSDPSIEEFYPYLDQINEVVVGFVNQPNLDFLKFFPNVTRIWIITSTVKNLDGLRYLNNLRSLAIDRPTCRMDILGELKSLETLYLDDWRPGAKSIFHLKGLVKVGVQKYGYPDLQGMSGWTRLNELWINAGKLEELRSIPSAIKKLRLTNLRKLQSLLPLSACPWLEELIVDGCRKINSLAGIEQCFQLRILSIGRSGTIESLEPLRNLKNLEHIFLADGTDIQEGNDVLYTLPNLRKLIITKQSGLEKDKVLKIAPNCEVFFAK